MVQQRWIGAVALTSMWALSGCDKLKATTDRAFASFKKSPCPPTARSVAAGTDKPEQAFACFQDAVAKKDTELLLRVTCQGKTAASCEQNDRIRKQADEAMISLAAQSWTNVLGQWKGTDQDFIYAVDTRPGDKLVSKVTLCRAVQGKRWAVCELGDMPREALPTFATLPKEKHEEQHDEKEKPSNASTCPSALAGRVAGAASADQALGCFQEGMSKRSTELLLRVTCQGKATATCTINEKTSREAERAFHELFELSWKTVVSHWKQGDKVAVYAIDTRPNEKRVHTLSVCRIAEGERWAICELGEMGREAAAKKGNQKP